MTKVLNTSNSSYRIKVSPSGTIILDTGNLIGEVIVTGDLRVNDKLTARSGEILTNFDIRGRLTIGIPLGVPYGGTGLRLVQENALLYGQGTAPLAQVDPSGENDLIESETLLTVDELGRPKWTTTVTGGSF